MITPEEFKEQMEALCKYSKYNKEENHIAADELMCKVLREMGYGEGTKYFEEMDKYYV